jgi:hypothetical protein
MARTFIRAVFVTLTLALCGTARGAAINLDFGSAGTAPDAAYAAAGTPGTWNNVTTLNTTAAGGFVDVTGSPTSLTLASSRALFAVTPSAQPFTGQTAALLGDYLVSPANDFTLTLSGLPAGPYRVLTYTVGRQDFPRSSTVTPFGNAALTATNTGVYAGSLQQGVTHSVHDLQVGPAGLTLNLFSSGDGFVTGMQISSIPEPGGLTAVAAALLMLGRRRGCRRW